MGILLLTACTTYNVKRSPDGTVEVMVKSTRNNIEQPSLHYERVGDDAVFDFSAANVDSDTAAIIEAFTPLLQLQQKLIQSMITGELVPAPAQ